MTTSSSPSGGLPIRDLEAVQLLGVDPVSAQGGRAHLRVADGIAVLVDELRVAADVGFGDVDAVNVRHRVEERGVDPPALFDLLRVSNAAFGAHDGVGVLVDVREQVIEGLLDGVGQHERPRHEGHAQHDSEGGRQETELVGRQILRTQCAAWITPRIA